MSTLNHHFDLPEQICYVECGFCTTILMVSVPCSSLSTVATVRCGHCTSLLSVNMNKTSFFPFHLLASLSPVEPKGADKPLKKYSSSIVTYYDCEEEKTPQTSSVVNKPPEKRQRTPSAYNRFIKEEIKRLKAENPKMAHREAFSTAAKNWANFPPSNCKGEADSCKILHLESPNASQVNKEGQGFRGRKVPRNSV
ncbi:axial regulator YABBY 4-like [Vigna radiata var. radiata]|uniref:Axial regulator YABBY 4-like n=1 Tax=Vigna radiata var. radiata TaxID=3916 RepID=A0A3Q0ELR4_VIGRR|nr:axial regulator YABBY 4-like [Vigna radiata var. radiata]